MQIPHSFRRTMFDICVHNKSAVRAPGSELVSKASVEAGKDNYRCASFVFRTILAEPWAIGLEEPQNADTKEELFADTLDFLKERCYTLDDRPPIQQLSTVAIYSRRKADGGLRATHFGITTGDGMVMSKFGNGYIWRHPYDLVPISYGTQALFIKPPRKSNMV